MALRRSRNQSELPLLVGISCIGWAINYFTGTKFVEQSDISAAVGAFALGLVANIYARRFNGNAFVVMVIGILFQPPSGVGSGGFLNYLSSHTQEDASSYLSRFETALKLISIAIGLIRLGHLPGFDASRSEQAPRRRDLQSLISEMQDWVEEHSVVKVNVEHKQNCKQRGPVLKATALPKIWVDIPDCCVAITIGSGRSVTQRVKGNNPVWNKPFLVAANPGSKISIQILHGKHSIVIAEAVTSVKSEHLQTGTVAPDDIVPLKLRVSSILPRGDPTIVLSFLAVTSKDTRAPLAPQSTTSGLAPRDLEDILSEASAVEPRPPYNQKFSVIVEKLDQFVTLGKAIAEVHPYAKTVWDLLTSGLSVLNAHYERNARIQGLWACVLETLDFMKDTNSLRNVQSLTGTVQAMMEQLRECIIYLTEYWGRSMAETVVNAIFAAEDDDIIQRFTDTFKQLKVQFDQRINVQQWKITQATGKQVDMISNQIDILVRESEDCQLKGLLAPDLHIHWSSTCLSGTRAKLLSEILSWAQSDSSPAMFWLSGAAGTGKSSVAGSVAELLKSKNILYAFVSFRRDIAVDDTPSHLLGSIAYQIAFFHEDVRQNVLSAIRDKPLNIYMLLQQARELVVQPLLNSVALPRVVIVIDALDECAADSGKNGKPGREKLPFHHL
ncbi:hypothetical protein D9615_010265 [Tricholomella constricta]|uniref:C2 domain-containing protein n=1 Tax=Tricholomella constricta TaxID=117010 RepID=A0A8H5GM90_9AGAR|nr:hypothetical protein D9615_010265 [Tricholomella constricta]